MQTNLKTGTRVEDTCIRVIGRNDKIAAMYEGGASVDQIASTLGVKSFIVTNVLEMYLLVPFSKNSRQD